MGIRRISDFIRELPSFRNGRVRDHRDAIEQLASTIHKEFAGQIIIDWQAARGLALPAQINHGRWLVQCPYCLGATMAEEDEPFFCPDCLMLENGGYPRPVTFPDNARAIEAVLMERPEEKTRNWEVYETVEGLKRENEHFLKGYR